MPLRDVGGDVGASTQAGDGRGCSVSSEIVIESVDDGSECVEASCSQRNDVSSPRNVKYF